MKRLKDLINMDLEDGVRLLPEASPPEDRQPGQGTRVGIKSFLKPLLVNGVNNYGQNSVGVVECSNLLCIQYVTRRSDFH